MDSNKGRTDMTNVAETAVVDAVVKTEVETTEKRGRGRPAKIDDPVLRVVYGKKKPLAVSDIAERVHMSLPALNRHLSALVNEGMVTRAEDKARRKVMVHKTEKGAEAVAKALSAYDKRYYAE